MILLGPHRDEIYTFLAFEKDPAGAGKVTFILAVVSPLVIYIPLYILSHAKYRLVKKLKNSSAKVFEPVDQ